MDRKKRYKRLKLKIAEVYDTHGDFAKDMGLDRSSISGRLNGKVEWKTADIVKACELLGIPLEEAYLYFFV